MKQPIPAHAPTLAPLRRRLPRNLLPPAQPLHFQPAQAAAPASAPPAAPEPRRRGSAAGRAILHAPGVSLPGVTAMSGLGLEPLWMDDWPM
ncbi:MAG: hypothetical protein ACI4MJ_12245 [Aristaeellaceae bacterium]